MVSHHLSQFGPAARLWFDGAFEAPTSVQVRGWASIATGAHTLLLAPTGSGKTLAAFLWALDGLSRRPPPLADEAAGVRVLYVSPLKALVYDIERNLRAPLVGLQRAAAAAGEPFRPVSVSVRTGDTSQKDRRGFSKNPGDVLVTTPESLYLLLTSAARDTLRTVETVIVDEIHAVAGTKRGVHLAVSLERLAALTSAPPESGLPPGPVAGPQRIGLSATQRPLDEIARFLGGDRPVEIVDASAPPLIDLQVVVPVADMEAPDVPDEVLAVDRALAANPSNAGLRGPDAASGGSSSLSMDRSGIWPAIHPRLLELIRAHHSTIVFCNSRRLCERLAARLNELAGEELVRAHHGSISRAQRTEIEDALKGGTLTCIVATSSLELGIDMGAVDLVIQVESPGAVSRGLQRIGRAGHGVGEVSVGRIFPKYRGDLLEAAVVVERMLAGEIEPTVVPRNCLDVLAQHVVSMVSMDDWPVEAIGALVRRAYPYRDLAESALLGTLEMLAGRYPHSGDGSGGEELFADLRPRVAWDRSEDVLRARRGSKSIAVANAGTIPDRGLFGVYLGDGGPRVGELDEEMVYESRKGDVVVLGATSWRVLEIKRDRVLVTPAPGEPGRLPFWRGEGPGRPAELGRAMGAFVRQLDSLMDGEDDVAATTWLAETSRLDPFASANLCRLLADQKAETGTLPTDRAITVERFRDELGDWRVCILSLLGSRVNAPWALALEAYLSQQAGFEVDAMWSDDGIVLRIADADEAPELDFGGDGALVLDPDEIEELVVAQLQKSGLFAARFRENAARALLLARRRPGSRTPLWAQRLRSQNLLAVAGQFPDFPVVLETFRECLQDVFDVPGLVGLMRDIRGRKVKVEHVETRAASPFARGLVYQYIGSYLYEGDAPLAERRAAALSLDRNLLRELLGQEELRELLDPDVMTEVEAELQGLADHRRARDADELHDLLRRVGDLSEDELRARSADDPAPWLDRLARERRAAAVRIAGERRWIAAEDIGRYREALGTPAPAGMPDPLLEAGDAPFESLLLRYSRCHAPFLTGELAARYGLLPAQVSAVLRALEDRGVLLLGEFRPSGWASATAATAPAVKGLAHVGEGREWCDPQVLQRLRRRTLAKLRHAIAPVEAEALGRFLPEWHGIPPVIDGSLGTPARRRRGGAELSAVYDAVCQLEGLPVPFSELERSLLPARVPGYRADLLDELGASGQIVWVGAGRLGARDGRVALFRRESVGLLLDRPDTESADDLAQAILGHLDRRGASFFTEIQLACPGAATAPLEATLWDLVWAGQVTNDTLHPLRALSGPKRRAASRQGRGGGRASPLRRDGGRVGGIGLGRLPIGGPRAAGAVGGRWSAVASLLPDAPPDDTVRAHARSLMLLERYGVVVREAALSEDLPGGFQAVYGVLRAMEESGAVRRGYFVEGPGGAQFALPGAVDRLRDARNDGPRALGDPGPAWVLSAADPANPYGALLSWPESGAARSPRRSAGSRVVLVDGSPALYLEAGGKGLLTFSAASDDGVLRRAVEALLATSRTSLRIDRVDGEAALESRHLPRLLVAGFSRDHARLLLPVPL